MVEQECKRIRACCSKKMVTHVRLIRRCFFFLVETGHIVHLLSSELKVSGDNRGSGAAGLCAYLCMFMCFMWCYEVVLGGGNKRVTG